MNKRILSLFVEHFWASPENGWLEDFLGMPNLGVSFAYFQGRSCWLRFREGHPIFYTAEILGVASRILVVFHEGLGWDPPQKNI